MRFRFALVAALVLIVAACDTAEQPSLYEPVQTGTYQSRPDPTVQAVELAPGTPSVGGAAVAGLSEMVITGTNFNASPESTFVYVGGQRVPAASMMSLSATQIRFRVPNLPGTRSLNVTVLRAENFGRPPGPLTIVSAFERWGDLGAANQPFGVAADRAAGVGYVSITETGPNGPVSLGIQRLTQPARQNAITTTFTWPEIDFFDNQIYAVRGVQAVFRFTIPATAQQVWHNLVDAQISLRALDVDAQGNVWTGGVYGGTNPARRAFYRITPAKVVTTVPFEGDLTAIERAGDYVYVAGVRNNVRTLWRYRVAADGAVGAEEEIVRFTGPYDGITLNALAVTSTGDVLVGTDYTEPVLRVSADGSSIVSHYPGMLRGTVTALRWLSESRLLISGARIVGDANSEKATNGDLVVAHAFVTAGS